MLSKPMVVRMPEGVVVKRNTEILNDEKLIDCRNYFNYINNKNRGTYSHPQYYSRASFDMEIIISGLSLGLALCVALFS